MLVIDGQVHLAPDSSDMALLAAMTVAEVDAALIVNQGRYGPDNTRQIMAARSHPTRFAVVAGVDPWRPDIDEQIERLKLEPVVVGVRVIVNSRDVLRRPDLGAELVDRLEREIALWESGGYTGLFAAAERHQLPVCIYLPGRLAELVQICAAFPDLQLVVDHLNLIPPPLGVQPVATLFDEFRLLIELAGIPNIAVKATGMPALSIEPFPFTDLWPRLHAVIDAYGVDRVVWGTDFDQLLDRCTYAEGTDWVRRSNELSQSDKEKVMGGALRRIFGWQPS